MDEYLERIAPVQIPKHCHTEPRSPVTEGERQEVRQLCGSLQNAAVNTPSGLPAKVGEVQSRVTRATVGEMLALNRTLHEVKTHACSVFAYRSHTCAGAHILCVQ